MSVKTQIDRISGNITASFDAVGEKGGTVPAQKVSGNLASAIRSIPAGGGDSLIANMQIPENQSIVPEVTAYINDVTMEGETV